MLIEKSRKATIKRQVSLTKQIIVKKRTKFIGFKKCLTKIAYKYTQVRESFKDKWAEAKNTNKL